MQIVFNMRQLSRVMSRLTIDEDSDSNKKLVSIVEKFYKMTHSEGTVYYDNDFDSDNSSVYSTSSHDTFTDKVLETLEYNLELIFHQLSNLKLSRLFEFKTVRNEENIEFFHKINLFKYTTYEKTICSYILKCLDFVNICKPHFPNFSLYHTHSILCNYHTQSNILINKYNCFLDNDDSTNNTYLCKADNNASLRTLFELNKIQNVYMNDDYMEIGQKFILDLYELITHEIDEIPPIREYNRPINNIIYYNVQDDNVYQPKIVLSDLLRNYSDETNHKNKKLLNFKLNKYNKNYVNNMFDHCNGSLEISNNLDELTMPNKIYTLLLITFKRLEKYFKSHLVDIYLKYSKTNQTYYVYYDQLYNLVLRKFEKLCEYIPLSLYYLYYINNDVNETILFSLYLTFCGNNMDFINVHSTTDIQYDNDNNIMYNLLSSIKLLHDKLLVNVFSITNNSLPDLDSHTSLICINFNFIYIYDVYKTLQYYYKDQYVPLWTTFHRLSGKYFLTEHVPELEELRDKSIRIEKTSKTLMEVYYYVLPWNLNLNTILIFHSIFLDHLDHMMNTFIYKQATIIILYFESLAGNIDMNIIRNSFKWFTDNYKIKLFYNYINLLAVHETSENVNKIIYEIQNLNYNNYGYNIDTLEEYIPNYQQLENWVMMKLKEIEVYYVLVHQYNMLIEMNTTDAMKFLDTFIITSEKI